MQNNEYPNSFVAIDFEYIDANPLYVCQVGMVKYIKGLKQENTFSRLVCPPPLRLEDKIKSERTKKYVAKIHDIDRVKVEDEKTFKDLLPEMEDFIDGLPLVAHNGNCVEKHCFCKNLEYYGITTDVDYENIIDTQTIFRHLFPKEKYGLEKVCEHYCVDSSNHHLAVRDAEMCGDVYLKLIGENAMFLTREKPHRKSAIKKNKYNEEDKLQSKDLDSIVENPFKNKKVVLTGFKAEQSQTLAHRLNLLGAIPKTGVTKSTDYLICGANSGPAKLGKAKELGVEILTDEDVYNIIDTITI